MSQNVQKAQGDVHKECYLLEEAQEDVQKGHFLREQVDVLPSKRALLQVKPINLLPSNVL